MSTLRALVADDDLETLRMVSYAVESLGAEVASARTGDELIQLLADASFDVVVTDVAMPWMTGLQAVHSVRTAGLTTPTVVITASRDPQITRQVQALGDSATLLYKPFTIEQLQDAVAVVIASASRASYSVSSSGSGA
jgi:CheY-like chemotaxis protein